MESHTYTTTHSLHNSLDHTFTLSLTHRHTQHVSLLLLAFESFFLMKSGVQINSVG